MPSDAHLAYIAAGFFGLLFLGCLAKACQMIVVHLGRWDWLWPAVIVGASLAFLLG